MYILNYAPVIPMYEFNHQDKRYIYKPCSPGVIDVFVEREEQAPKLLGRIISDDYRKRWQHFRNQQIRAMNRVKRKAS